MALSQIFQGTETQSGAIIYISDETGTYDVVSNPTGYGSPNTERSDLALIAITKYKATDGDVELTAEAYNPEVVTQFEYRSVGGTDREGHIEAKIYIVPKKTGGESPAANDFVYDFTGDQLERWNGSAWVSAANSELETYDWDHLTYDYIHVPNTYKAFNNVNKLLLMGAKSVRRTDLEDGLKELTVLINGSVALFAENSYAVFQEKIEKYLNRIKYFRDLS